MAFTGIFTKAVAVAAIGVFGATGIDTVTKIALPAGIEGYGEYIQPVTAGDVVNIDWFITKRTDCDGQLGRVWHGEGGFYLVEALRPSKLPKTTEEIEYTIQTQIPVLAPAGMLELSIIGEYSCKTGVVPFELGPVILTVVE